MHDRKFDAVLFDLGDTLLYFDGDREQVFDHALDQIMISLNQAGLKLGIEFREEYAQRLFAYFEDRDRDLIEITSLYVLKSALRDWGFESLSESFLRKSMADMYAITQEHWIPEKDALATIAVLHERGYRMGLVSNGADDDNTQALVDKLGARRFFDAVLSSAAVGIRKPNPQILFNALDAIHIPAKRAVMVGDKLSTDILGAQNAGIFGIWITRRADTAENAVHRESIQPDATISTLDELPPLLDQL